MKGQLEKLTRRLRSTSGRIVEIVLLLWLSLSCAAVGQEESRNDLPEKVRPVLILEIGGVEDRIVLFDDPFLASSGDGATLSRQGFAFFDTLQEMTQGLPARVTVRIIGLSAKELADEVVNDYSNRLLSDLRKGGEDLAVEIIRLSDSMSIHLLVEPDEFKIVTQSSEKQAIADPQSLWQWKVTPLKSGFRTLRVRITASLHLSDGKEAPWDVLTKDVHILVRGNARWVLATFLKAHWQWILGSPLALAVLAFLWKLLNSMLVNRKAKPRPIGFD